MIETNHERVYYFLNMENHVREIHFGLSMNCLFVDERIVFTSPHEWGAKGERDGGAL